jgi:hypothetical protein
MRRGILGLLCLLALMAGLTATAQAAKYDDDSVIVKFARDVSSAQRAALFNTAGVNRTVGNVAGVGARVVSVQGDPAVVARRLNRSALVSYAEPNFILRATVIPNDPLFPELYGLNNSGQAGGRSDADIDAPEGWDAAGPAASPRPAARRSASSTPASIRRIPSSAARRSTAEPPSAEPS